MSWPTARLDECTRIVSGATPATGSPENWDGDILWATPKDLGDMASTYIFDTPRKITPIGLASCSAEVLPANSVLFSSRAPIGHVAINKVPMATNQGFKSFVPDEQRLRSDYLYWWLKANRPYLESLGNGATFKEVSKAVVARIEIPLPPLDEQQRIADIFGEVEGVRQLCRESLAALEKLDDAIFAQFATLAEQSGRIVPLAHLARVTVGHVGPTSAHFRENGVPFLRTGNIGNLEMDISNLVFVSEEFHQSHPNSTLSPGDILVSRVISDRVRASIVPSELNRANCANAILVKTNDAALAEYLVRVIRLPKTQSALLRRQVGSAQSVVNTKVLQDLPVPVPEREDRVRFERFAFALHVQRKLAETRLRRITSLFGVLQHSAFSGELVHSDDRVLEPA